MTSTSLLHLIKVGGVKLNQKKFAKKILSGIAATTKYEGNTWDYLQTISPDPKASCIRKNIIEIEHDLQIIIPAYNAEQYIEECLDSVLHQITDVDYIITVVNDGSTDKTNEKLEKYADNPYVEIVQQSNKGLSGARNRALEKIRGKFITFLDSDDMLKTGAIDNWMKNIGKADIVEGGYEIFNDSGVLETVQVEGNEKTYGFPWGKIIRANIMENLCFPEGYWFEDTIVLFILNEMNLKIKRIPEVVYQYRQNPKGISATSGGNVKSLDTLYVTKTLLEDHDKLGLPVTERLYSKFLSQIRMNYVRTDKLGFKTAKAVFDASCELEEKWFSGMDVKNELGQSLRERNFGKYLESMVM